MIFQPEIDNAFIDAPNIAISQEGLHSLLKTIETELEGSEVYRRTMAGLEKLLEQACQTVQLLVKAVGREAIRLTLKELMASYSVLPITSEETDNLEKENLDVPEILENHSGVSEKKSGGTIKQTRRRGDTETRRIEIPTKISLTHHPVKTASISQLSCSAKVPNLVETNHLSSSSSRTIGKAKTNKKLDHQQTDSTIASEREILLRKIGQQLRQIREERSLSVQELHAQTLVPARQIRALEAGNIEQLPEDVYLRGFICKLGKALGINGAELAASLPEKDLVISTVTSSFAKKSRLGLQLNSIHLYLGYILLIAAAIGGLGWITNFGRKDNSVELNKSSYLLVSPQAKPGKSISKSKPGLQSSKSGIKAAADIA